MRQHRHCVAGRADGHGGERPRWHGPRPVVPRAGHVRISLSRQGGHERTLARLLFRARLFVQWHVGHVGGSRNRRGKRVHQRGRAANVDLCAHPHRGRRAGLDQWRRLLQSFSPLAHPVCRLGERRGLPSHAYAQCRLLQSLARSTQLRRDHAVDGLPERAGQCLHALHAGQLHRRLGRHRRAGPHRPAAQLGSGLLERGRCAGVRRVHHQRPGGDGVPAPLPGRGDRAPGAAALLPGRVLGEQFGLCQRRPAGWHDAPEQRCKLPTLPAEHALERAAPPADGGDRISHHRPLVVHGRSAVRSGRHGHRRPIGLCRLRLERIAHLRHAHGELYARVRLAVPRRRVVGRAHPGR